MSFPIRINQSMNEVIWKTGLADAAMPHYPELADDAAADLVVVGAGFCGLNIALHAATAGLDVILLEAGLIGSGASGRNAGFNIPHFPGVMTPAQVEKQLGKKKGAALSELVMHGSRFVFEQAAALDIPCHADTRGWLQPAHSAHALTKVRQAYYGWRALGAPVHWHSASEVQAMTGAQGYLGGWSNENGGAINPYHLAIGLGQAAQGRGVRIFERTTATSIQSAASGHSVHCGTRQIQARTVIVTTNAYMGKQLPAIQRAVIPLGLFESATKPLAAPRLAQLMQGIACFSGARQSGDFCRLDAQGRLITGGMITRWTNPRTYGEHFVKKRLKQMFPQLTHQELEIDAYWEGYCAVTNDFLPHIQRLGENLFSVAGFSTRGVNLSQNTGRLLGEFAAGKRELGSIPLPLLEGRHDISFWPFKTHATRFIFPYYQARDTLGLS